MLQAHSSHASANAMEVRPSPAAEAQGPIRSRLVADGAMEDPADRPHTSGGGGGSWGDERGAGHMERRGAPPPPHAEGRWRPTPDYTRNSAAGNGAERRPGRWDDTKGESWRPGGQSARLYIMQSNDSCCLMGACSGPRPSIWLYLRADPPSSCQRHRILFVLALLSLSIRASLCACHLVRTIVGVLCSRGKFPRAFPFFLGCTRR